MVPGTALVAAYVSSRALSGVDPEWVRFAARVARWPATADLETLPAVVGQMLELLVQRYERPFDGKGRALAGARNG